MKPIAPEYLTQTYELKPSSRFHRLIARMTDTYFDDLTDEMIEELERKVDGWRWMHADTTRIP